jgi:hypothetical protein
MNPELPNNKFDIEQELKGDLALRYSSRFDPEALTPISQRPKDITSQG